jgi:hypothetical protein
MRTPYPLTVFVVRDMSFARIRIASLRSLDLVVREFTTRINIVPAVPRSALPSGPLCIQFPLDVRSHFTTATVHALTAYVRTSSTMCRADIMELACPPQLSSSKRTLTGKAAHTFNSSPVLWKESIICSDQHDPENDSWLSNA